MKQKKVILVIFLILLAVGFMVYLSLHNKDIKVVKLSSENVILSAECENQSYRENIADYIIKGFATTKDVGWNENKTHIVTNQEFKISEYIMGQSFGDTILLQRFGGCVEDICEGVEEGSSFEEGREIILYLRDVNGELVNIC